MVKRSNAGLILALIASALTFILYFAFTSFLESSMWTEIAGELQRESREAYKMVAELIGTMKSLILTLGIANVVFGILGWRIKFFNGFLTLLGWLYIFAGGIVFFIIQAILTLTAASKNKKYFVEVALLKKIEAEKAKEAELRAKLDAESAKAE